MKSEVLSDHIVQVQTCDCCTSAIKSPLEEEGCSFVIYVCTQLPSHFSSMTYLVAVFHFSSIQVLR
jgi:hypothetical protein